MYFYEVSEFCNNTKLNTLITYKSIWRHSQQTQLQPRYLRWLLSIQVRRVLRGWVTNNPACPDWCHWSYITTFYGLRDGSKHVVLTSLIYYYCTVTSTPWPWPQNSPGVNSYVDNNNTPVQHVWFVYLRDLALDLARCHVVVRANHRPTLLTSGEESRPPCFEIQQ